MDGHNRTCFDRLGDHVLSPIRQVFQRRQKQNGVERCGHLFLLATHDCRCACLCCFRFTYHCFITLVQFSHQRFLIVVLVSRVLALSLLASIYEAWMGVVIALHWGMMSVWLALGQQQTACSNRCEELLSAALGLAYIVAFISPRDGPTRYVYLAYYLICFMENTAALVVW